VTDITARRSEAGKLARFIDAHGGRLGAFRGYGAGRRLAPTQPGEQQTKP
jgi:hypothetical protein